MGKQVLFVYGSLSSGMVHFSKIEQYVVSKEKGFIKGKAFRLPSGYPVVFLPETNETYDSVPGWWVELEAPDLVFKLLDEYHGYNVLVPEKSLFLKAAVEVTRESGAISTAFVYLINKSKLPKEAVPVLNGDWITDLNLQPPFVSQLTERQANYIRKLNSSSGRDIVPIDLDLYRELMKLDLIVDKGRRLALSKLGKEVARYLPEV